MADNYTARKQSGWKVVSIVPDVCKTPMGSSTPPVPYPVTSDLTQTSKPAGTVFANGNPLVLFDASLTPKTMGDAAGTAKGVKSGTVGAACWPLDRSSTVRVEGKHIVRHNDQFWMNGNYGGQKTKAERWKERQQQIADARQKAEQMPPGEDRDRLKAAADRFEKNNYAVERARLADNTYNPEAGAPEGWRNISDDPAKLRAMGLEPSDLEIQGSNFGAQVYEPDPAVFGNDMSPTVAFKGTNPTNLEDWSNNFSQGMNNPSPYYERAVSIGRTLRNNGANVHIAGHSLGGGMASAASRASGLPATTFNAAGLHPATVARYGGTPTASMIDAYRVEGDALTHVQEAGFWEGGPLQHIVGGAAPDAVGTPHTVPGHGWSRIDRHGMEQMIEGIEAQKEEDQAILKRAVGPHGASGSWSSPGATGAW